MHHDLVGSTAKRCNVYMNANPHQGRMDIGHGKIRINLQGDRLSSLPDELIHNILSFVSLREAIGTSVLSSRWRFIWTSMPYLNFVGFYTSSHFSKFVSNVMSRRNNEIQVSSVKLVPWGSVSHDSVKTILDYAFSHIVQQLTVTCNLESRVKFPFSLFGSHSLKHLTLSETYAIVTPTWDLPALTTLHLDYITLSYEHADKCIGLFFKCTNLRNLSLSRFSVMGTDVINICHPRLSTLTLENPGLGLEVVNVVAPELKNLTIIRVYGKHLISAPGLTSLVMKADYPLQLSTKDLPSLERVDLGPFYLSLENARKIVCLLQHLHKVKFLTLDWEFLELLSSYKGLISHPPSQFANLKILKFIPSYRARVCLEVRAHEKKNAPAEIQNYLLDSSQRAIFTMVSCEEMRVMRNFVSAQRLIEELRFLLVLAKKAQMNRANAPIESPKVEVEKQWPQSASEVQGHFVEIMALIKQGKFEGLLPTTETYDVAYDMISSLQHIKELVTELPASKRAVMQAIFSSMYQDFAVLMNRILGLYKDPMDEGMRLRDEKVN